MQLGDQDDELEFEEPRWCACGERIAYRRAKVCAACSRRSSAAHYARHRTRVLQQYHSTKALFTEPQLQARRARAYLASYVRRGVVTPGPCARQPCAADRLFPIQPDPTQPLIVVWACSDHRSRVRAELEGGVMDAPPPPRQARLQRRKEKQRVTWASEYDRVEAVLRELPAAHADALRAAASKINGVPIQPGTPLYKMTLVQVYNRWCATRA